MGAGVSVDAREPFSRFCWRYLMSLTFRIGWVLALAAVPLAASAADERACNMREAALPTNSITYVLCEQGLPLVTNDEGAPSRPRKIASSSSVRAVCFLDPNAR